MTVTGRPRVVPAVGTSVPGAAPCPRGVTDVTLRHGCRVVRVNYGILSA